MKSPNCKATALSLAYIEFCGRLTAGPVLRLRSGAARPSWCYFELIRATRGGNELQPSVWRNRIAAGASLGGMGLASGADRG
jgi:hypothetical protein